MLLATTTMSMAAKSAITKSNKRQFAALLTANASSSPASSTSIHTDVSEYYSKVLQSSNDLKTNACTTSARPAESIIEALKKVPQPIKDKFYGCGNPFPSSGLEGLNVLDLGSGSGRDCYLLSKLVGEQGHVTGIDMTEEQLLVAKTHLQDYCVRELKYKKPNMKFVQGYIEDIKGAGVQDGTQDLIVSNCVINLSPDKPRVIKGMYDALKVGGEAYFSDVYCDRRLSKEIKNDKVLWGECLAGALYVEDFLRIARGVGFHDPRVLEQSPITVSSPPLQQILGNAKFYSITYRLFKLPQLESLCEDYGQVAYYLGTLPDNKHSYVLDDHHVFETNRPMLVCGNTAAMISEPTRLGKHFKVIGDTSVHFGLFDCSTGPATGAVAAGGSSAINSNGGGCC